MCTVVGVIERTKQRPRKVFDDVIANTAQMVPIEASSDELTGVRETLNEHYGYKSQIRGLSRHRNKNKPKNVSISAILDNLQLTNDGTQFLRLCIATEGREILVFFADRDRMMLDYEEAVAKAVLSTFNETEFVIELLCCYFHFCKALNKSRDDFGLRKESQANKELQLWFRRLRVTAFVSPLYREKAVNLILYHLPHIESPILRGALVSFVSYFKGYGMKPQIFWRWNHFMNSGPRTTNTAEGWFNAEHTNHDSRHPILGEWIERTKTTQFVTQNRIQNLLHNSRSVAIENMREIERTQRLMAEMQQFYDWTASNVAGDADIYNHLDVLVSTGVFIEDLVTDSNLEAQD